MNAALTTDMHTRGTVVHQHGTHDIDKPLGTVLSLHACEKKARSGPSIERVYTLCRSLSARRVACLQAKRVTKRVCFCVLAPTHVVVVASGDDGRRHQPCSSFLGGRMNAYQISAGSRSKNGF
jgi:hypothetical protein